MIIHYQAYNPTWLRSQIETSSISEIVSVKWPNCLIEKLAYPSGLIILAGFTGKSANSVELISRMNCFPDQIIIQDIYQRIALNTDALISAWKHNSLAEILLGIEKNHLLLSELVEITSLPLLTKELSLLIEIAKNHKFVAKFSGAGGGDCGLAFGKELADASKIQSAWERQGIIPLNLSFG
jgi:phosphomevalonate kinase